MANQSARTVLVTTDFSDAAIFAYPEALKEAEARGLKLLLLHVYSDWGVPLALYESLQVDLMEKLRQDICASAAKQLEEHRRKFFKEIDVETVLVGTETRTLGDAVCDVAKQRNAEVIVLASRGHNPIAELVLGSVAMRVLHHAPCSVLLVKSRE